MFERRRLLKLSVAGAVALTCVPSAMLSGDDSDPLDGWLPLINAPLAAARVGAKLTQDHSEQVLRLMVGAVRTRLAAVDQISAYVLRQAVADDFRQGRAITAGGVLLSNTEAALCLRFFARAVSED